MRKKPLALIILDGWGMKEHTPGDALSLCDLPNFDSLWEDYPHTTLSASGLDVGLPEGQMGNSEVGHLNIGSGRIVYQDLTRISKSISDGDFFENGALLNACEKARVNNGALHLMGLVSDGGVHSHIDHIFGLLELAKRQKVDKVYLHCFLDGRDTATTSGLGYVSDVKNYCEQNNIGQIASVCGRFYAMDRDKRWDRVEKAYNMLVYGVSDYHNTDPLDAIKKSYEAGVTDEFVEPTLIVDEKGLPKSTIKTGDSVIFFNFRADRAREISHALTDKEFDFFDRGSNPPVLSCYTCMTDYDNTLVASVDIAYPPHRIVNTLSDVLSANKLKQLRIAETEKYAHVTFFFNGGVEDPVEYEDRILIPSPKVKTYDLQPEMSALEVANTLIDKIADNIYDVIIVNFANPDMVGHTGVIPAACCAVTCVDECLGKIVKAILDAGGQALITADHGNIECLLENGQPMTAHTTNKVPFILVDKDHAGRELREGKLEDIAPTMLELLDIEQPVEMTGCSLIIK